MKNNNIGINIKKLRQAKGISQDRLARLADVSYNSVVKLENGCITNPTIMTLGKLATALKCSIVDLIN